MRYLLTLLLILLTAGTANAETLMEWKAERPHSSNLEYTSTASSNGFRCTLTNYETIDTTLESAKARALRYGQDDVYQCFINVREDIGKPSIVIDKFTVVVTYKILPMN